MKFQFYIVLLKAGCQFQSRKRIRVSILHSSIKGGKMNKRGRKDARFQFYIVLLKVIMLANKTNALTRFNST